MKRLLVALIMLAAFFCLPVKAEAAGKTLRIPGPACQKGNDIYYCYTMGGLRMNLMKMNRMSATGRLPWLSGHGYNQPALTALSAYSCLLYTARCV